MSRPRKGSRASAAAQVAAIARGGAGALRAADDLVTDRSLSPVSFRLAPADLALLDRLCASLGVGRVQVLRLALRALERREAR